MFNSKMLLPKLVGLAAVMLFIQSASPVVANDQTIGERLSGRAVATEEPLEFCERGKVQPVSMVEDAEPTGLERFFSAIASSVRPGAKKVAVYTCSGGKLPAGNGQDLLVTGACVANGQVPGGKYNYHNVNIITASGPGPGGSLVFRESPNSTIKFYAESILVEAGGSLIVGTPSNPIGSQRGSVEIHLWGSASDAGIQCQSPGGTCGVPKNIWTSNNTNTLYPSSGNQMKLGNGVTDYFYQYVTFDQSDGSSPAYFGHKVLAVSYGGTLQMFGKKGATICDPSQPTSAVCKADADPSNTGTSWVHLNASLSPGATTLKVDRPVDWEAGDQIIVTTTDYVAAHSEIVTIKQVNGTQITLQKSTPIQYPHNGAAYRLASHKVPAGVGPQTASGTNEPSIETRAAVALLSHSIKVVSEGDNAKTSFDQEPPNYYFGAHTIARQGFNVFQIQGVEFDRLGQGGSKSHYALHFHMVRKAPPNTFIKDSSVDESMTRWYVIHASQLILLARNVGYKSIGQGYYLEDGTETDNKLYGNIGIFARSATASAQNPRNVPGILVSPDFPASGATDGFTPTNAAYVDAVSPAVFWIMNGWNDFEYNSAVGAGACGACYWLVPAAVSGSSMYEFWTGYAAEQLPTNGGPPNARAGLTPLQEFFHNSCSTAMTSFQTVGETTPCSGVALSENIAPFEKALISSAAPTVGATNAAAYYPNTSDDRFPTLCGGDRGDCGTVSTCSAGNLGNCAVTILDHFTSAFNWAQENYSAIWLRINWYLFSNSAVTDVQNGGLTFVSGGGYSDSDAPPGYWSLARNSVFVGNTQPCNLTGTCANPFASNAGPFNPMTAVWKNAQGKKDPLQCAKLTNGAFPGDRCVDTKRDITVQMSNFGVNQRLFNIYDGPSYQDANAYLDTNVTPLDCTCNGTGDGCQNSQYIYPRNLGVPRAQQALQPPTPLTVGQGYLPNAAIAWKQPNGFFYPPAFRSTNMYFDNVDIRHFVIEPLFQPGTFNTNPQAAFQTYCTSGGGTLFNNFTDIDRQTILLDDDGSLTGLKKTTSVNDDPFFSAPVETSECGSNTGIGPEAALQASATAKTSPYEYVTTAIYPDCALTSAVTCAAWGQTCTDGSCYGVPLYRQVLIPGEGDGSSIRMMGQATYQRSTLTVNNGTYYLDSSVSQTTQSQQATHLSVFQAGQKYYVYDLFARPDTKQTYQIYVGKGFNPNDTAQLQMVQVDPATMPFPNLTTRGALPSAWTTSYDSATGILSVTMDMSIADFQTDYTTELKNLCQPSVLCALQSDNTCGCALKDKADDPYLHDLFQQCKADANGQSPICHFAQADVKCPSGGCYGFAVTLASDFSNAQSVPPPTPQCAKASGPLDVPFSPVSKSIAGACTYSAAPQGQFCP